MGVMKIDGRTLSHEASETIRLMAVRRVREGESPSAVIKSYGLCRTTIYPWLRREKQGGEKALASRKGSGRPPVLTPKQKRRVRTWICGKNPRQYGFDFGLWTRRVVADLIWRYFKKRMSITSVGRVLAELQITPQKPLRRAYQRDPEAIRAWKEEKYPLLRMRANIRGAEIFFLDEAGIRSDVPLGRTWGEKGQTPVVETTGTRQAINAISAVNMLGAFWYDLFPGRLNAALFLQFLKKFMRGRKRPAFLVVDNHPAHIAKCIAAFVQAQRGKLELHFLPGYAPELNPDEFVWNHIRQNGVSKKPLLKGESLRRRVSHDLRQIKRNKALVKSFFKADSVSYIMD